MKYALLIYSATGAGEYANPSGDRIKGVTDFVRSVKDAGVLLDAEQLAHTDTATTVRVRGGDRLLTDGPFMETKEHLLGFFLLDVPDLDTALRWAERMPAACFGTIEVRAVQSGKPWQAVLG